MSGPDGNFSGCFCPVANIFTFVPPTSIARTFMFLFLCKVQVKLRIQATAGFPLFALLQSTPVRIKLRKLLSVPGHRKAKKTIFAPGRGPTVHDSSHQTRI